METNYNWRLALRSRYGNPRHNLTELLHFPLCVFPFFSVVVQQLSLRKGKIFTNQRQLLQFKLILFNYVGHCYYWKYFLFVYLWFIIYRRNQNEAIEHRIKGRLVIQKICWNFKGESYGLIYFAFPAFSLSGLNSMKNGVKQQIRVPGF